MKGVKIYNYLDEERKIMGFSLMEIGMTVGLTILGATVGYKLLAIIGIFGSVPIIRYIKELMKQNHVKRHIYYVMSDLRIIGKVKYKGKYYL